MVLESFVGRAELRSVNIGELVVSECEGMAFSIVLVDKILSLHISHQCCCLVVLVRVRLGILILVVVPDSFHHDGLVGELRRRGRVHGHACLSHLGSVCQLDDTIVHLPAVAEQSVDTVVTRVEVREDAAGGFANHVEELFDLFVCDSVGGHANVRHYGPAMVNNLGDDDVLGVNMGYFGNLALEAGLEGCLELGVVKFVDGKRREGEGKVDNDDVSGVLHGGWGNHGLLAQSLTLSRITDAGDLNLETKSTQSPSASKAMTIVVLIDFEPICLLEETLVEARELC
mmetsp:Transcript_13151/g.15942  ORF Transcript_13151/g.15942 Transcript_13151/m.15942 type:complete len:286 (-) Transcript_13151:208-1065(-)